MLTFYYVISFVKNYIIKIDKKKKIYIYSIFTKDDVYVISNFSTPTKWFLIMCSLIILAAHCYANVLADGLCLVIPNVCIEYN